MLSESLSVFANLQRSKTEGGFWALVNRRNLQRHELSAYDEKSLGFTR